uniref:C-type lectin domain-containing protein n=1 Tax=Xiphophorus couchianus TaxID=32473 RepID=A0A3B5L4F4_9TELE
MSAHTCASVYSAVSSALCLPLALMFLEVHPYCLDFPDVSSSTHSPSRPAICLPGWQSFNGSCYWIVSNVNQLTTWYEALNKCSAMGNFKNQAPTGISLWMGGHDSITEGGWEWTDGSPFRYIRWNAGNPDDYFGEDCLSILINDGYWNDDNCQNKRGYICKRRGEECCLKCC